MTKPININGIATTTEDVIEKIFYDIKLIKNDDDVNDLYFNFNKPIDILSGDYFMLKAGESIENWKFTFGKFYFKSSSDTVNFRLYGLNSNN